MERQISLPEHGEVYTALTDEQVSHIRESLAGKVEVSPTYKPGQYALRAGSYAGFAQLPDDCTLVIKTKVPISNILFLLGLIYDPTKTFFREEPASFTTMEGLFEFVVHIFTLHVEDLVSRGILRGYRNRVEDLQAIRGRLLIAETIQHRPVLRDRHWCRFSHFTADVDENIILQSTAHVLQRYVYKDVGILSRLRHIGRSLAEVSISLEPLELFQDLTFHRLNDHYRPALTLAQLLLQHITYTGIEGDQPFLAFLIDMDWLFEKVVGALLRRHTGLFRATIDEQKQFSLDYAKQVQVRPDVVLLKGRQPIFVLDAKYKLDPNRGDVYQVLAYCHALGLEEAALVYPKGEIAPSGRIMIREPGDVRIHYLGLDLSGSPEEILDSGDQLAEQVSGLIPYAQNRQDQVITYPMKT